MEVRWRLDVLQTCALLLAVSVCDTQVYACDLDDLHLQTTTEGREIVDRAIESANLIVRISSDLRFVPVESTEAGKDDGELVPVAIISTEQRSGQSAVSVPPGPDCVLVRPRLLREWLIAQNHDEVGLELVAERVLTFMLFHELGHLVAGERDAAYERGKLRQLNIDPSLAKEREKAADAYAVRLVKAAIDRQPGGRSATEALRVSMELSKLSWNLQAQRSLDHFGASVVGSPEVYFDAGLTHPNLAWRILNANHMILNTDSTESLLDDFESSRRLGTSPIILYERSDDTNVNGE